MWRVVWLVAVVACAPPAKPPRVVAAVPTPAVPAPIVVVDRPLKPRPPIPLANLAFDEIHDLIAKHRRWPLTRAYALEPHFALGPRWGALCDRPSVPRFGSELDEYIAIWCH